MDDYCNNDDSGWNCFNRKLIFEPTYQLIEEHVVCFAKTAHISEKCSNIGLRRFEKFETTDTQKKFTSGKSEANHSLIVF
jgi:hypothetical protein